MTWCVISVRAGHLCLSCGSGRIRCDETFLPCFFFFDKINKRPFLFLISGRQSFSILKLFWLEPLKQKEHQSELTCTGFWSKQCRSDIIHFAPRSHSHYNGVVRRYLQGYDTYDGKHLLRKRTVKRSVWWERIEKTSNPVTSLGRNR